MEYVPNKFAASILSYIVLPIDRYTNIIPIQNNNTQTVSTNISSNDNNDKMNIYKYYQYTNIKIITTKT
ncbi:hypothetical protein EMUCRT_0363 [Ehrlichia cf. muris str. EmCRT]|uniref:Uncharacterized protein n=1 Tax=Ehrlichia cf. muris str. EmCRT TaxID=1359167 RepID=A0A0F3NCG8_9RICK|nr:hypothetical protein EMUCRT_0363 [Ehrlichia cf. muris str. EmCRT]